MKSIHHFDLLLALVTGLICSACNKTEPSPQPSVVTNAPVAAPPKVVTTNAPIKLSAQEAKAHVGEVATVTGKVASFRVTQKGDVFLNIGGTYPNQPFTAVCFQAAIPADDLKKFVGKTVKVTGEIKDYNGQIEIVLERASQISE
jgi:RecG-like helicase